MSADTAMVTDAMVEAGAMALAGDEWKGIHDRPRFLRDARECLSAALAQAEQPVAYIVTEALAELRKHKDASATVWSGLNSGHPFNKDATPLYAHPPAKRDARVVGS